MLLQPKKHEAIFLAIVDQTSLLCQPNQAFIFTKIRLGSDSKLLWRGLLSGLGFRFLLVGTSVVSV